MKVHHKFNAFLLSFAILFLLSSCSKDDDKNVMVYKAVALEKTDECHLCGMLISNFVGPKGEVFRTESTEAGSNKVKKFCSTRDMFSFYLDPEHKRNVTTILVHDMSKSPWDEPNDDYFINAKTAWFVAGSIKAGAMGQTLASFSLKEDAEFFTSRFGGEVLSFDDIDLSVIMK